MNKEIKYGGFSANPNDHDGLEGDLAVALNLIPEDNTIKPVMPPLQLAQIPGDPVMPNDLGRKIVCIHKTSEYTHYIVALEFWSRPGNFFYLYWWDGTAQGQLKRIGDVSYQDIISVEPVGNTLVVLTSEGVHYLFWDLDSRDNYKYLGQKPPRIDITWGLDSEFAAYPGFRSDGLPQDPVFIKSGDIEASKLPLPTFSSSFSTAGVPPKLSNVNNPNFTDYDFTFEGKAGEDGTTTIDAEVEKISNFALGAMNKFVRQEGTEKGRFIFPFFVRYAYEMYDGSKVMHSYPVLMVPNSRGPVFGLNSFQTYYSNNDTRGLVLNRNGDKVQYTFRGRVYGFVSKLCYDAIFPNLDDWKDIIHKVNVYVSAPIYTYDQDGKVYGWKNMDGEDFLDNSPWDSYYTISRLPSSRLNTSGIGDALGYAGRMGELWDKWRWDFIFPFDTSNGEHSLFSAYPGYTRPSYILTIPEPDEDKMRQRILDASNFYLIHSFDIDELSGNHSTVPMSGTIDIEKGVLETLLARDTLPDDYFTRDTLIAKTSFSYNSRVNLAGVSRLQHKPLDAHIAWAKYKQGENGSWNTAVKVKSQDRTNILVSGPGQNDARLPLFVFYPDPNAAMAYIERGGVTHELKLTRHPHLWGAYWLGSLWKDDTVPVVVGFPADNAQPVKEYNAVYTSKVNNPFFFPKTGVNTITTGEIMALCSAVRPVSTGQVGFADLYIFADNGVWTAKINDEGYYSDVTLVAGDICTNPESVTQMETTVLFTTARGIMLMSGSQAQCISEAIDDKGMAVDAMNEKFNPLYGILDIDRIDIKHFRDFMKDCRICYDYRGQRIIVYNPAKKDGTAIYPYAYIYSLQSNKWGMMQADIDYTVRAYPEAMAVTHDGTLVNYSERRSVDVGSADVCQLLITRPLTLDLPNVLKTASVVLQRGMFRKRSGRIQCAVYGSRDLFNWHLVASSQDEAVRGFRGTPYKWFRVAVMLHLQPDEAITGCTIQFEPRQTNRLR